MSRFWVPLLLVFVLYSAVVIRLGQLQLVLHSRLSARSDAEVAHKHKVRPLRARILDRKGRVLAETIERPSIFISFKELEVPRWKALSLLKRALPGAGWPAIQERWLETQGFL